MKTKGVSIMMMIMLGLIGSDYNEVESKNVSNDVNCKGNCVFDCFPLVPLPTLYLLCVQDCCKKCCKKHYKASNCNSICILSNSIDINTGIYLFLYKIIL